MATHMTQNRSNGNWRVTVELESGRRYRFRYLVDGKDWLNEWHADDYVENPYGSSDSVVDLTDFGETTAQPVGSAAVQMGHHFAEMGHERIPMDTKMVSHVVMVKLKTSRGVSTRFLEAV